MTHELVKYKYIFTDRFPRKGGYHDCAPQLIKHQTPLLEYMARRYRYTSKPAALSAFFQVAVTGGERGGSISFQEKVKKAVLVHCENEISERNSFSLSQGPDAVSSRGLLDLDRLLVESTNANVALSIAGKRNTKLFRQAGGVVVISKY